MRPQSYTRNKPLILDFTVAWPICTSQSFRDQAKNINNASNEQQCITTFRVWASTQKSIIYKNDMDHHDNPILINSAHTIKKHPTRIAFEPLLFSRMSSAPAVIRSSKNDTIGQYNCSESMMVTRPTSCEVDKEDHKHA